eukprot:4091541-Amphidinium_carterae.1
MAEDFVVYHFNQTSATFDHHSINHAAFDAHPAQGQGADTRWTNDISEQDACGFTIGKLSSNKLR